jgi:phosphohistidine swiveling domain-containing protein
MERQTLCMWTDGESLTRIARDFVLDRQFDRAVRFLVEGLDGMTFDLAHSILLGDTCLAGHSPKHPGEGASIYLDQTEDLEWKAQLQWIFAGAYLEGGVYWAPYAVVTNFGKEDYIAAGGKGAGRALHYADDPANDRAVLLTVPGENGDLLLSTNVLFRKIDVPVWWTPRASALKPQEALADFLTHSLLEYRSHTKKYGREVSIEDHADAIDMITAHDRKVVPRVDLLAQEARVALDEKERLEDEYEAQEWETTLKDLHERILEQAGPDDGAENSDPTQGPWFTLKVGRVCSEDCHIDPYSGCMDHPEEGQDRPLSYRVASAPFISWALNRTQASHLAPPWKNISPSGMKLMLDDPYHTDWMLSAGLNLGDDYSDPAIRKATYSLLHRLQEKLCEFKCAVLSGRGKSVGYTEVCHPKKDEDCTGKIAVIPSAGPAYTIPAMTAEAVITERGGELAHLSVVGRESGVILVRVPDARRLYPKGCQVRVDAMNGEVEIDTTRISSLLG